MKNDIIVFQERHFHFGLNPDEFVENVSLNSAWIFPADSNDHLWRYERGGNSVPGEFVHFGSLLGLTSAYFNNASQVFLKKTPDSKLLGICISGSLFQITIKRGADKPIQGNESLKIPDILPRTIFSRLLRYKRKTIYIVDPILLFRAYNLLF